MDDARSRNVQDRKSPIIGGFSMTNMVGPPIIDDFVSCTFRDLLLSFTYHWGCEIDPLF